MKFNKTFWIALVVLVVWLVLSWFLGTWLGIHAPVLWILRIGLAVLGIAGFVGYLLLRPKDQDGPMSEAASNAATEIDNNFAEAQKRIQAATGVKQLNSLPAIFVLGDSGAAKTSILSQSGIEAEVIAGQAMQANMVVPTTSVNLWYSRNTLFIDPSGSVVADPGARRKLFKKFVPVQLNSVLASKTPPTRSVLLAVDCEMFLLPDGPNVVAAKAREYQTVLSELSRELGSSFPVYVLFTKADRLTYFREFVENLNDAEIAEMMGVSIPMPPSGVQGSYAERQSARLNNAFKTIYYSLTDKRPVYLARERNAGNLSNIYEFPREFGKLQSLLVQFLTDLCRPSQLGTSPFLRGFYFTGVRPIVINEVIPAMQVTPEEDAGFDAGATRMFNRQSRSAPMVQSQPSGARKVPQWVYLRSLFPGILLADRVGTSAAQVNVKVNFVRRLMWASAAVIALGMGLWWTVSYRNNSQLAEDAVAAANAASATRPLNSGQLADLESLQKLSKVRETLEALRAYGQRWSYRAFLGKSAAIEPPLRITYFTLFRRLLLAPTQQTLIGISKTPGDEKTFAHYDYVYNALKAYLMTTHDPDKHWDEFVKVLMQHWNKDQKASAGQASEAEPNFAFYAKELPGENPSQPDPEALKTARTFLNGFDLEEGVYRFLLNSSSDGLQPLVFNHDFPGTSDSVINMYEVPRWYTKTAYENFQKRLKDDRNLGGEDWVLGQHDKSNTDYTAMRGHLAERYDSDYIKTWRAFMAATSEKVPYGLGNYIGASGVLGRMSGPKSTLMQLFCLASENTSVNSKAVLQAFQPVQLVAPPGCIRQLVSAAANPYVLELGKLSEALKAIGPNPSDALAAPAKAEQANAIASEGALTAGFQSDTTDRTDAVLKKSVSLLYDPIEDVTGALSGLGAGPVNQAAGKACSEINNLFRKYPFSYGSHEEASLDNINEVLNPQTGKLWALVHSEVMKPLLQQNGVRYDRTIGQTTNITQRFLDFINKASVMTQAMYRDASGTPNMSFTLQALPSPDIDFVTLTIDGTALTGEPKNSPQKTFPWPGPSQGVSLSARMAGSSGDFGIIPTATGLWSAWRALDKAVRVGDTVQWTPLQPSGDPLQVHNHPATVRFGLDPQSAQILRPQFFAGMSCPVPAAQ